jgi:hypothetical protein
MDETLDTGGSNWADWFQSVAGGVIGKAADAQYVRPYDIQSLRLQQLGASGYYTEGMAGTRAAASTGISPGLLLLAGAAVVAVLMLKD